MKLFYLNIIATLIYIPGMIYLLHEFRTVSAEVRRERQTVQMLLSATALYITVIWKLHALAAMLAGG